MPKVKEKNTFKKELGKELYETLVPVLANLKLMLDEKQFQQNLKDAVKTLVRGAVAPKEVKKQKEIKSTEDKKEEKVTIDKTGTKTKSAKSSVKSAKAVKVTDVEALPVGTPKKKITSEKPVQKAKEAKAVTKK